MTRSREELEAILLTVDGEGVEARRRALYEWRDLMFRQRGRVQAQLDSIPGAFERHQRGLRDVEEGRVTSLDLSRGTLEAMDKAIENLREGRVGDPLELEDEEEVLAALDEAAAEIERGEGRPIEEVLPTLRARLGIGGDSQALEVIEEWAKEIDRRVEQIRRGEVKPVPSGQIFEEALERLRQRSTGESDRVLYLPDREHIDEIVSHMWMHLEQMDDRAYYLGVDLPDGSYAQISIRSESPISVTCYSHTPDELNQAGWKVEVHGEDQDDAP